jgi:hypothetical protein
MAKQTFSVGQTLTAAQMTSLQQTAMLGGAASAKTASYTLVAADAGTAISMSNASATTITVNTALFAAGDTVHITNLGAGVCTITAGTATVNSSASLALAQYESGFLDFTSASAAIFVKGAGAAAASGGMTLISETVASGLSSLSLSSIPSTYKQLILAWNGIEHSEGTTLFNMRFNNVSTSSYGTRFFMNQSGTDTAQGDTDNYTSVGGTPLVLFGNNTTGVAANQTAGGYLVIDNYASSTKFKTYTILAGYTNVSVGARFGGIVGTFNSTTAISSIDIFRVSGAATFSNKADTSIRLYGLS